MLTIMKYEVIRQKLSKWIMLGLLAVLEVAFLITLYTNQDKWLGMSILGLSFLAMFSLIYVSLESIINYNQDLSRKSGYMVFMTPNSVYEILGAKILNSIFTIVATSLVYGITAFIDIMLVAVKYDDLQFLWEQIQEMISQFTELNLSTASIVSTIVLAVISWISTVALAFLAITLTYTLLHSAPAKGIISFAIFIGLDLLVSWAGNLLRGVLPENYVVQALGSGMLAAVIAALCIWLDGWMLTRKMAL